MTGASPTGDEDLHRLVARVGDSESGASVLGDYEIRLERTEGRAGVFWLGALGRVDLTLLCLTQNFASAVHAMDAPAWVIVLEGAVEVEVSGGDRQSFMPGAVIRFDDTLGQGHRLRGSPNGLTLIAIARETVL